MDLDFGEHARIAPSDRLEQLSELVLEMERQEILVHDAKVAFDQQQERLRGIVEHELPELMLELGQPVLHTSDGRKIEVKEVVRARLPEAVRGRGHEWLIDNGYAGIVKRTVEVAFPAKAEEQAKDLLEDMEDTYGQNARQVMKVESSTLTAFVRKQLEREAAEDYDGPRLPRDIFEVREFQHAKVK